MIVVVADDLSGAAELAGAALNHGLAAEVQTDFTPDTNADVVCLDTNTRPLRADEAARITSDVAGRVAASNPQWIYKKCDSVLRGNVLAEIGAIVAATSHADALLISANPARGRIIRGGDYFVNEEPLHHTPFAKDPEHPRRTSRVTELLGGTSAGVRTPDAETSRDLDDQARALGSHTLPAGGVEFFEALLRAREKPAGQLPPSSKRRPPQLFVCGSAAAWTKGRGAQAESHGIQIEPMPEELLAAKIDSRAIDRWADRLAAPLRCSHPVMAAIARAEIRTTIAPANLADRLATAVARALPQAKVGTICAEGGATAAAIARAMRWTRLEVVRQLAGGVVELQPIAPGAPAFIIKVGSYDWPDEIWPQ